MSSNLELSDDARATIGRSVEMMLQAAHTKALEADIPVTYTVGQPQPKNTPA